MRKLQPTKEVLVSAERGGRRKKWKDRLPVALVFPNTYLVGMSNLGFQMVYSLLNADEDIVCERFFFPPPNEQLRSVESSRPLSDFPLLFASFSFEADYVNFVAMLLQAGINPRSEDRKRQNRVAAAGVPLIVGGGVATFINPEPLAEFIDLFLIGEAEPVFGRLTEKLKKRMLLEDRSEILKQVAGRVPGCYVPALYSVSYNTDQTVAAYNAAPGAPVPVKKVVQATCRLAGHSQLYSPAAEFSDLHMVELGRGCSRGCRFCAAGFVYRPPRLWPTDAIVAALEKKPKEIERIGLLGMEMTGAEELGRIASFIFDKGCTLSFSSLRADALSEPLVKLLGRSGLKTATIAPDGTSERLRRVINKGISEQDILAAAATLFAAGLNNLKLYVMIGLPTEEESDLDELVALLEKLRKLQVTAGRSAKKMTQLTMSVNCFIPKAWTPFQYASFTDPQVLKKRLQRLKARVSRLPNVRMLADKPENAFSQAVLARGDRRLSAVLLLMAKGLGQRQAMKKTGLDGKWYAMRERPADEIFPWDIIDHGIKKQYLYEEYRRGLAARTTRCCLTGDCHRCGVC
jgi:radical SAM superfamily enzyme YgiQ (UPF0313 family)